MAAFYAFRSQSEENKDIKRFRQRGRNMSKKKRILFSLNERCVVGLNERFVVGLSLSRSKT